jgi:hypothetical protein
MSPIHYFFVINLWSYVVSWATGIVFEMSNIKYMTNSVALVHERTIPTERAPLVGEVSANFYG